MRKDSTAAGKAAIDGGMQQDLLQLLRGAAVVERPVDVGLQLVGTIKCRQHRHVEDAAHLARDAGPRPDAAEADLVRIGLDHGVEAVLLLVACLDEVLAHQLCDDASPDRTRIPGVCLPLDGFRR